MVIDKDTGQAHGDVTFTAANGDQLHMTFTGQIDSSGHGTATFVIDSGTGRFANASGSLQLDSQDNFATGQFTFTLEGTYSYRASDRAG